MNESHLLAHIYARSAGIGGAVKVGPGDDCAVVEINGRAILLTTDQLIESTHYTSDTPLDLIARKAIARSVSDIAAMGGRPICALATAALRRDFTEADELFDRMATWAQRWSCPLAGGDIAIADGPTVLTTSIVGEAHETRGPVLRGGARIGDLVCVTGELGRSFDTGKHLQFEPRLVEGVWLCDELGDRLGAMLDISDGLGRDAARIAEASGVRIELDAAHFPCAEAADWRSALSDGEDYELLFTVRGEAPRAAGNGTPITIIGRVVEGSGCVVRTPEGDWFDASESGWDHHS